MDCALPIVSALRGTRSGRCTDRNWAVAFDVIRGLDEFSALEQRLNHSAMGKERMSTSRRKKN